MKILILQQGSWARKFGIPLADYLREKVPDARFSAVIVNPIAHTDVKAHDFPYEHLWNRSEVDDYVLSPEFKENHEQISIEEIEQELDIESVWLRLIYTQRSLVYTPGVKHRYSWDQQVDDAVALNVVRSSYVTVKNIFEKWEPDIIITPNYVSVFHNCLYHFAKKRGVGMWRVNSTRISGHYILTDDNLHRLKHVVERFTKNNISQTAINFARKYVENFRAEYIPPENYEILKKRQVESRLWPVAKRAIFKFYKIPGYLFSMWKSSKNSEHPKLYRDIRYQPLYRQLRNHLLQFYYTRRVHRADYHTPSNTEDYVYFPLQYQPEETTMLWAPYANNQIEFARQIAMGLPAGITLYVREHPAMIGRRSPRYYEKLTNTPNIKLISPFYSNQKILGSENNKAVISLSGTTGFEAMLLGKPILLFADMFYEALPHCQKVTDLTDIPSAIKQISELNYLNEKYDDALIKFIAAIKEESFEIGYASMWGLDQEGDKSAFFEAFASLIKKTEFERYSDTKELLPTEI